MSEPPWGAAEPLLGCAVVGPREPPQRPPERVRASRPAVVVKIQTLNRFLDHAARSLTPAASLVWMTLLRDERGGTARTAVTDLARRCGLSDRTVKRHLAVLKKRGLVEVAVPGARGAGPTEYRLHATAREEE